MTRKILIIVTLLSLSLTFLEGKSLDISTGAESAILINASTGEVLYEKKAHQSMFPASVTKIATAIYAINVRGDKLDKQITAEYDSVASISEAELERSNYTLPAHWLIPGASHIGIKNGEVLSLKDLLYGTLLASGGDSSNVIAQYIGGTIPTFMKLLNDYLKEIGCQNTVFKNPHGLHHPQHVTTAYDMAILAREAMKNQTFREIVKTVQYTRPQTNKQKPTTLVQGNRLLRKGKLYYPKAIGIKTGYTSKAQNTLVAAARDGDRTLIAVLMKGKDREEVAKDAIKLFETAFNEKKVRRRLLAAGPQKAALKVPKASKQIHTYLKNNVTVDYYPAEEPNVKCLLQWEKVELPVEKGQRVGMLCIRDQHDKILAEESLYALEDVNYNFPTRIKKFLLAKKWITLVGGVMIFLLLGFFLITYRSSR